MNDEDGLNRLRSLADVAHLAAHAVGLKAGDDVPQKLVPAVRELVSQRDALAAQISQARALVGSAPELNMSNYDEDQVSILNDTMIALADLLENNDETSLAQRDARMKAQWQAEGARQMYDLFEERVLRGAAFPGRAKLGIDALKFVDHLRRQAERGE